MVKDESGSADDGDQVGGRSDGSTDREVYDAVALDRTQTGSFVSRACTAFSR